MYLCVRVLLVFKTNTAAAGLQAARTTVASVGIAAAVLNAAISFAAVLLLVLLVLLLTLLSELSVVEERRHEKLQHGAFEFDNTAANVHYP